LSGQSPSPTAPTTHSYAKAATTRPAATRESAASPTQCYYDPTTGRWTQQDPEDRFGSATQGDRFLFAGADPLNLSDPTGLSVEDYATQCAVSAAIGAGVGAVAGGNVIAGGIIGCASGATEVALVEVYEEIF
jgi:RHS repeat-associated protein